jgi:hypothetical protein
MAFSRPAHGNQLIGDQVFYFHFYCTGYFLQHRDIMNGLMSITSFRISNHGGTLSRRAKPRHYPAQPKPDTPDAVEAHSVLGTG